MAAELKGEDVSISVNNALGAPVLTLGRGVETFKASPDLEVITSKNLDGVVKGSSFNGWKGVFKLNLRDTLAHTFIDSYIALMKSGAEYRVTIMERVFDPQLRVRRNWTYPRCVLTFDMGEAQRASAVQLTVNFETGMDRLPG